MIWVYRIFFVPLLLLASPYYLWRMRRRGGYWEGFSQRFGVVAELPTKRVGVVRIWLQAVSVGEMLAVGPLIEAWAKDPHKEVYLTTTTSTGYALAKERYKGKVIAVGYFPTDWFFFSRRAWRAVQADLAVLTEGERWPEHLAQARVRGVPSVAINARLSDRSHRRMRRLGAVAQLMVRDLTWVLAAAEGDAVRFRELGVEAGRIEVTGNIKLDVEGGALAEEQVAGLRRELGFGGEAILLGASTWPGEEAVLLEAFLKLRAEGWPGRLMIVPRHAERRGEIRALLEASGLRWHQRSLGVAPEPVEVVLADTTGELRRLVGLAEVVLVGKSLPPHTEGQTPVEAAAMGKAAVMGPGMTNFRAIASELVQRGAARMIRSGDELTGVLRELLADDAARGRMGEAGRRWHRDCQGALGRTLVAVERVLEMGRDDR